MKKLVSIVSLFLVVGIISGCGPSAQEQYKDELKSQSKMNDQTFKVTIDTLSINSNDETTAEEKMNFDVMEKQLKGLTFEGSMLKDKKTKNVSIGMATTLFGQKLEYDIVSDNKTKDFYINGEAYNPTVELINQFTDELPVEQIDSEVLKGKYIHLTKEELDDSIEEADEVASISDKQYSDFFDSLEKDSFKKEGDTITHQFTKKELEEFVDSLPEKKNSDLRSSLEERLEQFKKLTIDLTLDTKKHTKKAKIVGTSKAVDGYSYTMKLSVEQKAKNSEKRVTIPSKEKTISLSEFATEAAATVQEVKLSDEDMKTLIENVQKNKEYIDAETAEKYKETYLQYLNEEQASEFNKVLDEIVVENNQ